MLKELKQIDVFEIALGRNPVNRKKFFSVKDGAADAEAKKKEQAIKDAKAESEKALKDAEEATKKAEEAAKALKDLEPEVTPDPEKEKAIKDAEQFWAKYGLSKNGNEFNICFFGNLGHSFVPEFINVIKRICVPQ